MYVYTPYLPAAEVNMTWSFIAEHPSSLLRQAAMPVVRKDVCKRQDWLGDLVKGNVMCVGYADGGVDSCYVSYVVYVSLRKPRRLRSRRVQQCLGTRCTCLASWRMDRSKHILF